VYERSKGFIRSVSLGKVSVSWFLDTMRPLLQAKSLKKFFKRDFVVISKSSEGRGWPSSRAVEIR
jgi:hypothetical protein